MIRINQKKLNLIKECLAKNYSYQKISVLFGVTRQSIYHIIKKYRPYNFNLLAYKKQGGLILLCRFCGKPLLSSSERKQCSEHAYLNKLSGRDLTREKIRIRDNHTCQICGFKWNGGRRLDVHHKDCRKEKTKQYDNYAKEQAKMITLCHKCHLNIPEHRKTMQKRHKKCSI